LVPAHIEEKMPVTKHNPGELFPPYHNYSHAIEVSSNSRLLFISGLNGYLPNGTSMPDSFQEQGEIIWGYIGVILKSAGMTYKNIVSLRTYLSSPEYDEPNVKLRMKYLSDHQPASTVICCQLLDSKWKVEIEAVAAA
jgi:enamine deaminase RidA (YjgF/YER057c/UK114 family)